MNKEFFIIATCEHDDCDLGGDFPDIKIVDSFAAPSRNEAVRRFEAFAKMHEPDAAVCDLRGQEAVLAFVERETNRVEWCGLSFHAVRFTP